MMFGDRAVCAACLTGVCAAGPSPTRCLGCLDRLVSVGLVRVCPGLTWGFSGFPLVYPTGVDGLSGGGVGRVFFVGGLSFVGGLWLGGCWVAYRLVSREPTYW